MAVIEKAILLFKNEGIAGERFADTVKRLGFEYVNEKIDWLSIKKDTSENFPKVSFFRFLF